MSYFCVLVLFGTIILVHELGHFVAARAIGVHVETFSLGFGPTLFGIRLGETNFRISALPFGGYVRMLDEQTGGENVDDPRSFQSKARWQRAIVIIAGPVMNIVLAVGILAGLYMYAYPKQVGSTDTIITVIKAGSPAADAGLQPGDWIVELTGKRHPDWDYVRRQEALNADHSMEGIVERHGHRIPFRVTVRMDPKRGIGEAGWGGEQNIPVGDVQPHSPAAQARVKPDDLFMTVNGQQVASPVTVQQAIIQSGGKPVDFQVLRNGHLLSMKITPTTTKDPQKPFYVGVGFNLPVHTVKLGLGPALEQSLRFNNQNAILVLQVLGGIVERRVSPKSLSGPIRIAQMSREAATAGAWSYLFLMAFVSLQVAIFNLLPIPILDGTSFLILIVEMLIQRDVSLQMKNITFKLGFVFLIMIVAFSIYNDITRLLTNS